MLLILLFAAYVIFTLKTTNIRIFPLMTKQKDIFDKRKQYH